MKSSVLLPLLLLPFFALSQVGVNTTAPNAMLDVNSTNQGMLIPRIGLLSAVDAATVVNPQGGSLQPSTLIYNTATAGTGSDTVIPGFYYWNSARWIPLSAQSGWQLSGNTATNDPAAPTTYGTSVIAPGENFIGTTDGQDVVIGTDNVERMRIKSGTGYVAVGTANPFYNMHVVNSGTGVALHAENTFSGNVDNAGIRGRSINNPGYGTGGIFTGGDTGISARAEAGAFTGSSIGINASAAGTAGTRIGGYFFAIGGDNNYAILTPQTGGFVGIGTQSPTHRLEVSEFTAGVPALLAVNNFNGITHGTGIRGFSVNNPGYGTGGEFQGGYRGVYGIASSGGAGTTYGVYGTSSGGGTGTRIGGYFTATGGSTRLAVHANGPVRISDGTQAAGRVLTSDANGNASWQSTAITNVVGILGAGVDIPASQTGTYSYTGSRITLPPGRYAVQVTMLMAPIGTPAVITPANSSYWLRTTFADIGTYPNPSADIVGSVLVSGNLSASSTYGLVNGTVIINNTTAGSRTYYYMAGRTAPVNTNQTLDNYGGWWDEDNIIAYRLN